jgi:hypothetical protein
VTEWRIGDRKEDIRYNLFKLLRDPAMRSHFGAILIAKNPLHPAWRVSWPREEAYLLDELADWLFPADTCPEPDFGGCRHWFRCPSCQRRCRLIYGGAHFRCRICRRAKVLRGTFSAMYRTCQLHKKWRCSIAAGTTAPASSG